jgi:ATP/maltotriose-dependent transcriptional regulator MalT
MDFWRIDTLTQSSVPVASAGHSFRAPSHEPPDRSESSLSPRERSIVFLMGQGMSNKQIARKLSIAPETVKTHSKRIFIKLTVCSRAQAVYQAVTLGLIALQ